VPQELLDAAVDIIAFDKEPPLDGPRHDPEGGRGQCGVLVWARALRCVHPVLGNEVRLMPSWRRAGSDHTYGFGGASLNRSAMCLLGSPSFPIPGCSDDGFHFPGLVGGGADRISGTKNAGGGKTCLDLLVSPSLVDDLLPLFLLCGGESGTIFGMHREEEGQGPLGLAPILVTISGQELLISTNGSGGNEPDGAINDFEAAILFFFRVAFIRESGGTGIEKEGICLIVYPFMLDGYGIVPVRDARVCGMGDGSS